MDKRLYLLAYNKKIITANDNNDGYIIIAHYLCIFITILNTKYTLIAFKKPQLALLKTLKWTYLVKVKFMNFSKK